MSECTFSALSAMIVVANIIDDSQLVTSIGLNQVSHLMFTFSGNDPRTVLMADLTKYNGKIEQFSVGLREDADESIEHRPIVEPD
jgi:hypothetical protein